VVLLLPSLLLGSSFLVLMVNMHYLAPGDQMALRTSCGSHWT
jgi:hypothetical protein